MSELENLVFTVILLVGFFLFCWLWIREGRAMKRHRKTWTKETCHHCGQPDYISAGETRVNGEFHCRTCKGD